MLPQVIKFKRIAIDLLFPQWCISCGQEGSLLCPSCSESLPRIAPPHCPQCGRPQSNDALCPSCASRRAEIEGIRSPFQFEGTIRQAVHQLKYNNLRGLGAPLAKLLREYLAASPVPGEVLVPVPLHQKRLKERGYNQSQLMADELGKLIALPVIGNCLVREHHTPPQARTTTVEERWSNIAEAFICVNDSIRDKKVLLIDDVSTSGATLNACARALKAAGAASVWGLVLAREV